MADASRTGASRCPTTLRTAVAAPPDGRQASRHPRRPAGEPRSPPRTEPSGSIARAPHARFLNLRDPPPVDHTCSRAPRGPFRMRTAAGRVTLGSAAVQRHGGYAAAAPSWSAWTVPGSRSDSPMTLRPWRGRRPRALSSHRTSPVSASASAMASRRTSSVAMSSGVSGDRQLLGGMGEPTRRSPAFGATSRARKPPCHRGFL